MQPDMLLAMFYEDAPDIMCVLNPKLEVVQSNDAVYNVLGLPRSEVMHHAFLPLILQDDHAIVLDALAKCQQPQCRQQFATRSRHKQNAIRWLQWTATRGPDHNYYLVGRDITQEYDTQNWLNVFQQAIDASPLSVLIADANQQGFPVIYLNHAFEQMTGYDAREILGRNCRILQGDDKDQPALQEIRDALAAGKPADATLRNYRKDGALFYNRLHLAPVYNPAGKLTHYIGMQQDVTKDVLAQQALEAHVRARTDELMDERERIRQIVNTAPVVLYEIDLDGNFVISEGRGLTMIGLEPGAVVGLNAFEIYRDWPQEIEQVRRVMQGEEITTTVHLGPHVFEAHHTPRYNENGDIIGVVGIAVDMTERFYAQRQVEVALERMKDLSKTHNNFVSMVSHEFRTPLTNIMNSAQLLQRTELPPIAERRQERYQRIYRNIKTMTELMEDILKLGEAEEEAQQFQPEPMDLHILCAELCDQYDPKGRRIQHTSNITSHNLTADKKLLRMALGNLLNNALKYSDKKVEFRVIESTNGISFIIQDYGIGIPEADQEALFRHFYRASNAEHLPGSGLGLAITQRAVALHNGTLTFESVVDEGTTFTLTIPHR